MTPHDTYTGFKSTDTSRVSYVGYRLIVVLTLTKKQENERNTCKRNVMLKDL